MPEVVLQSVTKRYPGGIAALCDLDLDVDERELLVLLGPSGCGKTTTLRLIAGLETPDAGAIRIGGRDVTRLAAGKRDVSMVFQDAALYPHMNVRRNLAFAMRIRKLPREQIDTRIDAAAAMLEIAHLLDRSPVTLSGGELQRVALGRAIARRPRVLLLDEPMSDLDERLRLTLRTEIRSLQRRLGITTIHVTHDHQEAMAMADRIAVMFAGRIHQVAPPEEIYDRPSDRLVAGFVGSPPMNFIEGRIEQAGEGDVFTSESLRIALPLESVKDANTERAVTLGVRPQHLHAVTEDRTAEDGVVHCTVAMTERLVEQSFVHARTEVGLSLIARLDGGVRCDAGDGITLRPDVNQLHLFESGPAGRRL